ncbi:MAG: hypothetical protein GWO02_21190, partial [Gammaproteobacteria bacterium]|nr:hypothetical protein [Gammaproteobacteria bacterium]
MLEPLGVRFQQNMVFDLASNERVSMPSSFGRVFVEYPFWVRALSTGASAVSREIDAILLPWASSIDTASAPPGTVTPLFTTSRAGGADSGMAFLSPQREFSRDSLRTRVVAALVNPSTADGED